MSSINIVFKWSCYTRLKDLWGCSLGCKNPLNFTSTIWNSTTFITKMVRIDRFSSFFVKDWNIHFLIGMYYKFRRFAMNGYISMNHNVSTKFRHDRFTSANLTLQSFFWKTSRRGFSFQVKDKYVFFFLLDSCNNCCMNRPIFDSCNTLMQHK